MVKKISLGCILIFAFVATAFGQSMVVREAVGKVEYSLNGGSWNIVNVGMTVPLMATIATGFGSRAVLESGDSRVVVEPLTRLTLEELQTEAEGSRTSFNLRTGRIQASVRRSDGAASRFEVRSPVATAAVRGTEFSFNGFRLQVQEGAVAFSPTAGGRSVSVPQGTTSRITQEGLPQEVVDAVLADALVDPSAIPDIVDSILSSSDLGGSLEPMGLVVVVQ